MENLREIEKSYSKLLSDPYYDKLSLELKKANIFKVLGISNYELKHSNFLAWLLDPNETHDLGDLFLNRFLTEVLLEERCKVSLLEIGRIENKDVEIRREWKNIDILLITKEFVVCIENKFWSKERNNQLKTYKKRIEEHFPNKNHVFVYLTPYGEESSMNHIYINSSYSNIIDILDNIIQNRRKLIGESILTYLEDYISILKQVLMKDDNANRWAIELYKNHKELFDFVWENKPDFHTDFANILNQKVLKKGWRLGSKNKGYVRFYTPLIEELILKYKQANGWPNKEAFLFEFDFHLSKKLIFQTVVSPPKGYYEYDSKIVEILDKVEGASKEIGEKWKCHFTISKNWDLRKKINDWNKKEDLALDEFIEEITPIVIKIESALINNQNILEKLKEDFEISFHQL